MASQSMQEHEEKLRRTFNETINFNIVPVFISELKQQQQATIKCPSCKTHKDEQQLITTCIVCKLQVCKQCTITAYANEENCARCKECTCLNQSHIVEYCTTCKSF
jgi:hypothetical protein